MIRVCRAFLDEPQGFLTIHGNNGTGKSTALMAIVGELLGRNVPAVYMTATDLIRWLQDGFGTPDDNDTNRLKRLAKVGVLCLDELQMVNWDNAWTERSVTDLLNWRYTDNLRGDAQLGTVIAQDVGLNKLPQRVESRLHSGKVIANNDRDFRPVQGAMT